MEREYSYKQLSSEKNDFAFKDMFGKENKELFVYALALFLFPLLPLNQLIVGTIVNALLIKSAIDYNSKRVFLLALIPSLAVVCGGVLFANLTLQILLMLPIIWLANFSLMFFMKKFSIKMKKSFAKSAIISSAIKTTILIAFSLILFTQNLVPAIFLTMFGTNQLITSLSGATIIFLFKKVFAQKIN